MTTLQEEFKFKHKDFSIEYSAKVSGSVVSVTWTGYNNLHKYPVRLVKQYIEEGTWIVEKPEFVLQPVFDFTTGFTPDKYHAEHHIGGGYYVTWPWGGGIQTQWYSRESVIKALSSGVWQRIIVEPTPLELLTARVEKLEALSAPVSAAPVIVADIKAAEPEVKVDIIDTDSGRRISYLNKKSIEEVVFIRGFDNVIEIRPYSPGMECVAYIYPEDVDKLILALQVAKETLTKA